MALKTTFTRTRVVTTADHGDTLVYGNAAEGQQGAWVFDVVPDGSFSGALVVVGRGYSKDASESGVGFVAVPYRSGMINGVAGTWAMASTTLTDRSIVSVPASGLSVGFTVACTAGTVTIYSRMVEGAAAP